MPEVIMQYEDYEGKMIAMKRKEELIRCDDCIHWYMDADAGMACSFTNLSQPEDGYCNWAVRKKK